MMTPEELQAAYVAGRSHVSMDASIDYEMRKHLAGLAEVVRQQAEHDAQIAERAARGHITALNNGDVFDPRWEQGAAGAAERLVTAIRAQFPKEAGQ